MAIQVTATKESLAGSYAGLCKVASLHTASPGAAGTTAEATGGSPAYAAKPIVWNAGGSDGVYTSDPIDFDVPAGTYTHVGLWDGTVAARGAFRDFAALSANGVFTGQGVFRVTLTYTQT